MFLMPLFAVPAAFALIKLGALSVWVSVLSTALAGAVAVIAAVLLWELVRKFRRV